MTVQGVETLRQRWQAQATHLSLKQRLYAVGFPLELKTALEESNARDERIREWVRANLTGGMILRTAQAELVAIDGLSLDDVARETGCSTMRVLHHLCTPAWAEFEEP